MSAAPEAGPGNGAVAVKTHAALHERWSLRATLVAETALHVGGGAGGGGVEPSDLPVARDGRGKPYVPGSSLRGSLRSSLEALVRGVAGERLRVCDPFCKDEGLPAVSCSQRANAARQELGEKGEEIDEATAHEIAWRESCEICRLFGHSFFASRLRVADLPLVSQPGPADSYVRDGVGIDRDLRSVATGILYQFEAVPAGSRFALRMEVDNPEDHEVGLLLTGFDLLAAGFGSVGGKTARGLGWSKVEGLQVTRRRAADFFSGSEGEPVEDLDALRAAAKRRYVEGGE